VGLEAFCFRVLGCFLVGFVGLFCGPLGVFLSGFGV